MLEGFEPFGKSKKHISLYLSLNKNIIEFAAAKHAKVLKASKLDRVLEHTVYLEAEKQHVKAQAQITEKWVDFVKRGKNLMYQTANDDRVRENHRILNGIVKPANDRFWALHTPPLGWRCRCNVIEVEDEATRDKDIPQVSYDEGFSGTHGYFSGSVFGEKHPNFNEPTAAILNDLRTNDVYFDAASWAIWDNRQAILEHSKPFSKKGNITKIKVDVFETTYELTYENNELNKIELYGK